MPDNSKTSSGAGCPSGGRRRSFLDRALRDRDEANRAEQAIGPEAIARAEAAIDNFGRSIGSSDAVYLALANISRAGGAGTFEETIQRTFNDPGLLDRPWWWLAVVAERAVGAGRPTVTAKIGAFTEMFVRLYLAKLNLAGSMDAGLSSPPQAAQARICVAGLTALARFRPEQTILGQITGHSLHGGDVMPLTVGAVEQYLATTLIELAGKGAVVDSASLDRAGVVLAGRR